jgi:hypothetical protein
MKLIIALVVALMLAGCANSSRNLTVKVYDGGVLNICGSTISPEVMKSNTDERASNATDVSPTIPLVP